MSSGVPITTSTRSRYLHSRDEAAKPELKPAKVAPKAADTPLPAKEPPSARTRADARRRVTEDAAIQHRQRALVVSEAQVALNERGEDPPLEVDGKFGPLTEAAVRRHQEANGLKVDGRIGPNTMASLRAPIAYAEDMRAMKTNERFRALDPEAQANAIRGMRENGEDADARGVIRDVAISPALAGLDPEEQRRATAYVGGMNPELSPSLRTSMRTLLDDPTYQTSSPEAQTAAMRDVLATQPDLPESPIVSAGRFDAQRRPYTVSAAVDAGEYEFPSGTAPADRYEVDIEGQVVPVFVPKTLDPSAGEFPAMDEVAKGIAALPPMNRDALKAVVIDPQRDPEGAFMRDGADGVMEIFPVDERQDQDFIDSTMMHETGHTLSQRAWGPDTNDPRWDAWKAAMASDTALVSGYARRLPDEDFSEALVMYNQVLDTPQELEVRALMPERFRIIDELLARQAESPM